MVAWNNNPMIMADDLTSQLLPSFEAITRHGASLRICRSHPSIHHSAELAREIESDRT